MKLAAACTSMKVKAKPARGGKRTRASGGMAVPVEKKKSEKERRQRMKALCEKLASLIPKELFPHADTMTHLGTLDVAASYIKKLKERVDELQHKKASAQGMATLLGVSGISTPTITDTTSSGAGSSPLVVEVRQSDDASMEVRLICSTERPIKLHEVITILEEEGAVVINANHSIAAHIIFYTVHSRAFSTRIGIDVSRISERLGALDAATQLDQLDSAAAYIKQLKTRIDDLKRRKQAAVSGTGGCSSSVSAGDYKSQTAVLPVVEVRCQDGSALDVALASEAGRPFRLHEVISVLEQEGAEVVSASFSVVGDKIFYTLHSQALCPRIGLEAGRVAQRLRGLAAAAATVSTLLT